MTEPAVKRELRERFLALRRAITPAERREKDAAICRNIRALECYRRSECVAIYATTARSRICSACGAKNVFSCPVTGRT